MKHAIAALAFALVLATVGAAPATAEPLCECIPLERSAENESYWDWCAEQSGPSPWATVHAGEVAVAVYCPGEIPPQCERIDFWSPVDPHACCYF